MRLHTMTQSCSVGTTSKAHTKENTMNRIIDTVLNILFPLPTIEVADVEVGMPTCAELGIPATGPLTMDQYRALNTPKA